jgi:metal-dependent amidase/aminoacylase/carboxypeptidase family protein
MTEHPLVAALKRHEAEMIAVRHQIHRNPEVGFEETRTAALVAEKLREFGLDDRFQEGCHMGGIHLAFRAPI